eukprot:6190295-Pleurochrysis_carterae.AAC.3
MYEPQAVALKFELCDARTPMQPAGSESFRMHGWRSSVHACERSCVRASARARAVVCSFRASMHTSRNGLARQNARAYARM